MSALLIFHIIAGSLGIVAGVGAVAAAKGRRFHRAFGWVFCAAMSVMAVLGSYLALFTKATVAAAPPQASATVAVLSLYLVATAWLTVRRRPGEIGRAEYGVALVSASLTIILASFGTRAAIVGGPAGTYAPYFVFATFAACAATFDIRLVRQGGISGPSRIARHLWRMCFAWFFACAFFFIGQKRVMPASLRGSPVLVLLGFAPLIIMLVWLTRIWATRLAAHRAPTTLSWRVLNAVAIGPTSGVLASR